MASPDIPAWPEAKNDIALQYKVHLGLWTDWSRGQVMGLTLTLDRQQANLLIAFTASFVVFIGSRFWHIISKVASSSISCTRPQRLVTRSTINDRFFFEIRDLQTLEW